MRPILSALDSEDKKIRINRRQLEAGMVVKRAFTLVELLVVISIMTVVMGIAIPAFNHVRRQAINLVSMNNQKQITSAINIFSNDNDDRYPESVATIGYGENWNWTDPTRLTGNRQRSPRLYRSMSRYLKNYVTDASSMFCPCSPQEYQYLKLAWEAGENWDNPETTFPADPVGGSYCFYWNYKGVLEQQGKVFQGPHDPAGNKRQSTLLVTDYFGYDHWRTPAAFGSCEVFDEATEVAETLLLSSYWSAPGTLENIPEVTLRAGYTDGHVETFSSRDTVQMKVSITSDGKTPYPDGVGPGIYLLPSKALQ
ncbi:MAG: type II secretion system protein [Sedimentisphaerales bacterium]|nr:type II secretion system protein [Sedimentisphaerales bacterium]